jgi:hypothetical protein
MIEAAGYLGGPAIAKAPPPDCAECRRGEVAFDELVENWIAAGTCIDVVVTRTYVPGQPSSSPEFVPVLA